MITPSPFSLRDADTDADAMFHAIPSSSRLLSHRTTLATQLQRSRSRRGRGHGRRPFDMLSHLKARNRKSVLLAVASVAISFVSLASLASAPGVYAGPSLLIKRLHLFALSQCQTLVSSFLTSLRMNSEIAFRLIFASMIGGMVGQTQRFLSEQKISCSTNVRMFSLVALGSCLFTVMGTHGITQVILQQQQQQQDSLRMMEAAAPSVMETATVDVIPHISNLLVPQPQQLARDAVTGGESSIAAAAAATAAAATSNPVFNQVEMSVDVSRMASSVATGVGFIGAGVITNNRNADGTFHIRGLTSAASIWVSAAVGIAVGSGLYFAALLAGLSTAAVMLLGKVISPSHVPAVSQGDKLTPRDDNGSSTNQKKIKSTVANLEASKEIPMHSGYEIALDAIKSHLSNEVNDSRTSKEFKDSSFTRSSNKQEKVVKIVDPLLEKKN